MTEKEALAYLAKVVRADGVKDGLGKVAADFGVKFHTVYGWWRRESIPEWRLPSFDAVRKRRSAA